MKQPRTDQRNRSEDYVTLQAHHCAWRFAAYDRRERLLRVHPIWWRFFGNKSFLRGWYGRIGKNVAVLYCADGAIHVGIGRREYKMSPHLRAELSETQVLRTLSIFQDEALVESTTYSTPRARISRMSHLDAFVEEEQFDFALLIRNILNSRSRQRVLLGLE